MDPIHGLYAIAFKKVQIMISVQNMISEARYPSSDEELKAFIEVMSYKKNNTFLNKDIFNEWMDALRKKGNKEDVNKMKKILSEYNMNL